MGTNKMTSLSLQSESLTAPCVYRVIDTEQVTYIGAGTSGMGRIFDISPEQKGRTKAFAKCNRVEITFFSSQVEALKAEATMIHQLHPKFNGFCSQCGYYVKRRPKRLQGKGLLFGKARHDLLSLLLINSEKAYHMREIVRLIGMGMGAVQREINGLASKGILKKTRKGNQVFYQAETLHPVFQELRSMVLKGA
jgi:hypothetical protein